ncbi:hypothetical protein GCK32_014339 [Trichostrongylus colubriformis]|uniref:ZP domain-containing protein n=1 Tax=Trichostrongylus colubriformis TaxID=6319 RepID=A0AAN8IN29_TRICO
MVKRLLVGPLYAVNDSVAELILQMLLKKYYNPDEDYDFDPDVFAIYRRSVEFILPAHEKMMPVIKKLNGTGDLHLLSYSESSHGHGVRCWRLTLRSNLATSSKYPTIYLWCTVSQSSRMFLAVILHTMFLFLTAQSIPIDNGVEGEPEIECGSTAITVNFNTRNNFEGYVYVKPHFLTKVDHAYRVSCFYMETIEDILDGGVHGNPVPYGKIGQQVYHRWSCTTQSSTVFSIIEADTVNTFCMLVHSCSVDDGKGDREAHVYKYADRSSLFYECQISIQVKEKGVSQVFWNTFRVFPNKNENLGMP